MEDTQEFLDELRNQAKEAIKSIVEKHDEKQFSPAAQKLSLLSAQITVTQTMMSVVGELYGPAPYAVPDMLITIRNMAYNIVDTTRETEELLRNAKPEQSSF